MRSVDYGISLQNPIFIFTPFLSDFLPEIEQIYCVATMTRCYHVSVYHANFGHKYDHRTFECRTLSVTKFSVAADWTHFIPIKSVRQNP